MGRKENLDSFDVAKFVLSAFIVAIHVGVGGRATSYIFPWARIAVPIFFLITGYLFFRGYIPANPQRRKARLAGFIRRNLQLYLLWYIVQFLPSFAFEHYYRLGIIKGLFISLGTFVVGKGFTGSWYIMASVIAVCIIVALMRHMSALRLLALFTPLYIICCLLSNYANLLSSSQIVSYLSETLFQVFNRPYNSFVVALFWISLGKALFEYRGAIETLSKNTRSVFFLLLILAASLALLGLEHRFVRAHDLAYETDCYFFLPLSCAILFVLLLIVPCKVRGAGTLRAISTVTYCSHGTFMRAIGFVLRRLNVSNDSEWTFIATLIACWILSIVILKLERRPSLGILKYSH